MHKTGEEVLNLDLFKQLYQPAFLINAARGKHMVEREWIYGMSMDRSKYEID